MPTMDIMPMARPLSMLPRATPVKANGMENMITNGPRKDSNWEAITIYTRITIRATRRSSEPNISCCSS